MRRSTAAVAQGLTAAGIAGCSWSARRRPPLPPHRPRHRLALLALTTATAVALAMLHGPIVALLGLVAASSLRCCVHGQPAAAALRYLRC